ncbi:ankyrin [Wilcoxina mikolae CBS 423.85]|nr:ankyrin [Wilcoxina mikolae CBS 423.85]
MQSLTSARALPSCDTASTLTLLSLPSELLLLIGQYTIHEDSFSDIYSLLRTNRRLSLLLQPLLLRASILRDQGTVPLRFAMLTGNIKFARMLIEKYPVALDRPRNSGYLTLLHEAAANGNYEMTQLLLDSGANVNATGIYFYHYGPQSLHWSAIHFAIGGPLNHKDNFDTTTAEAIVRLLVKHGADINSQAGKRETPLAIVAWYAMCFISRCRRLDRNHRPGLYPPKDPFLRGRGRVSLRGLAKVLLELGANKHIVFDNELPFNETSPYWQNDQLLIRMHLDAIDAELDGV